MKKVLSRRTVLAALGSTSLVGAFALRSEADQPHMQAALDHLQGALKQLEEATPDKGGHRGRAMQLVRQAIVQVEKGIAFDRRH